MRYLVCFDGDTEAYMFDGVQQAAVFAFEENDRSAHIWDMEKHCWLGASEMLLACIKPRKKTNWKKAGF